ncbi:MULTISPECIES: DUF302 domain-containing protein [unclassified Thioalkalivibrio]|uniref:DUF302 domain-containing protein n=1 Tax=unclassified Thioalkalivibrio TaxID=2621013 RepID=UPI00036AF145|nr:MULTISPECIES: DUF302 domain-containing protein [unclassified Thioalkalivibrio]PYG03863.1 uncharacterized protein (DUF302 family) [Thioalkalivibrio sp. ALE21]
MQNRFLLGAIIGLIAGIVLAFAYAYNAAPGLMIVEDESQYGYAETIDRIETAAEAEGWAVPTKHDLSGTVGEHGYDVAPVTVLELCQPDHAGNLLSEEDNYVVTSMMPCRVSVYERSDGTVIVSRMNTSLVARVFGGSIAEIMAEATEDNERILESVLQ